MSVIITGKRGAGKSTLCERLFDYASLRSLTIGGVITLQNSVKWFYLLPSKLRIEFETEEGEEFLSVGRFKVHRNNMIRVTNHIEAKLNSQILIIDEIGLLEMRGEGYYPILNQVVSRNQMNILVVKEQILNDFVSRYPQTKQYRILRVENRNNEAEYNFLKQLVNNLHNLSTEG